jgi:hypothetical protein
VVLGHWLAYVAAVPQPHTRAVVLTETGHGYFTWAVKLAVVVAIAGVGAIVLRSASRAADLSGTRTSGFSWLAWRLAFLQVVAFTAMEITERVAAGAPVGPLFGRLYLVGIAAQFLVACVGAIVLLLLARVVAHAVRLILRRAEGGRTTSLAWRPAHPWFVILSPVSGAAGVRGPPTR